MLKVHLKENIDGLTKLLQAISDWMVVTPEDQVKRLKSTLPDIVKICQEENNEIELLNFRENEVMLTFTVGLIGRKL